MLKPTLLVVLILFMSCSSRNITVIAHRGASGYLPEHTLPAVALAHGFNVDYIEPDLVLTKDNQLIVMHDIHLDTTTNVASIYPKRKRADGKYYAVDFSLREIKRLKVYERSGKGSKAKYSSRFPRYKSSFKVPTFDEYVEMVKGLNKSRNMNIGIYPELKSPAFHKDSGKDIVAIFLRAVSRLSLLDMKMIVQCFEPLALQELRSRLGDKVFLVQLVGENSWKMDKEDYAKMLTDKGIKKIRTYADGLGIWIGHMMRDRKLVKKAKDLGFKVHAYTYRKEEIPNEFSSEAEFQEFLFSNQKLDGIFSDFPDL